ncbi:MAG: hypothetical protein JXQ72_06775 [Anaerolineae bacterium]|nr:hypothetical protein [Anaerolineae bacterium]
MPAPLSVRRVETPADYHTFLNFPWTLYKGDPVWVPPLLSMQRHKLDREHNPSWSYMEGEYFIARRGDRPVGTVAAFINHRHNEFHGENIGFFGQFDVYDDPAAAHALLQTAAEYVQARGCDALRGPASFSTNDLFGVLLNHYEEVPPILTPYNYPYYVDLMDSAPGFKKVMDCYSYHFTLPEFHASKSLEQARRITHKNSQRRDITIRPLEPKRLRQELDLLKDIYSRAWEKNWGFVPFIEQELDELVKELGPFLEPRLTLFATVKGQPAAFLLAYPDMNEVLHRAHPRPDVPEPVTMAKAVWHWKLRPAITRIRIALLGVDQQYRSIGVEAALFARLFEVFRELVQEGTRWQTADAGWVLETNTEMTRLAEASGGQRHKVFRLYERAL